MVTFGGRFPTPEKLPIKMSFLPATQPARSGVAVRECRWMYSTLRVESNDSAALSRPEPALRWWAALYHADQTQPYKANGERIPWVWPPARSDR
jgi:hypothetical protein